MGLSNIREGPSFRKGLESGLVVLPAAEGYHHCPGRTEVRRADISKPSWLEWCGQCRKGWQCLGTWATWEDLGEPGQGRLGFRMCRGGVQRACRPFLVRQVLLANSGSSWAVLKYIPLPGACHGLKHVPCHPAPRHRPASAMAAVAGPRQPHGFAHYSLLTTIPGTSAIISGHPVLCLKRREKDCSLLWKLFTPPVVIADHIQRTDFVSFSLIPTHIYFQGWYQSRWLQMQVPFSPRSPLSFTMVTQVK